MSSLAATMFHVQRAFTCHASNNHRDAPRTPQRPEAQTNTGSLDGHSSCPTALASSRLCSCAPRGQASSPGRQTSGPLAVARLAHADLAPQAPRALHLPRNPQPPAHSANPERPPSDRPAPERSTLQLLRRPGYAPARPAARAAASVARRAAHSPWSAADAELVAQTPAPILTHAARHAETLHERTRY